MDKNSPGTQPMGAEIRSSSLAAPETEVALVKAATAAAAILAQRWGPSLCGNPVGSSGMPRSDVVSLLAPAIQPLGRNFQKPSSLWQVQREWLLSHQCSEGYEDKAANRASSRGCTLGLFLQMHVQSHVFLRPRVPPQSRREGKVAGTAGRHQPPPSAPPSPAPLL